MNFGGLIRQTRSIARLSQKAMAAELGVSQGYLTDVERGRRSPTPKLANAMVRFEQARGWPDDATVWHGPGARECGWILPDLQAENAALRARVRELKSANRGMYELMNGRTGAGTLAQ
jgi:transcriptional regulator with XRE-family HTH domain